MSDIDDLCFTPAVELAAAIRRRSLSPVEVMTAIIDRIERLAPRINCFVTLQAEQALSQARIAEAQLMSTPVDELPALHGLPVSVKDLEDTAGVRTTYGSKNFANHVPTRDAPIWARLKANGAILLGKTTTPEFGFHSVTESLLTGITNNPWDLTRTTGGSSGGAAAAVAAGFGPLATGSDGGGSIRVPSSFCGVVGLKATPGRIPINTRESAFESVVVVGPITRTVGDCALMLNAVAGPDPYDAISLPESGLDYLKAIEHASVRGLRIGFCADLGSGPVEAEVSAVLAKAVARIERELGARVDPIVIDLPDPMDYFMAWWGPHIGLAYEETILPFGKPENTHPLVVDFVQRTRGISVMDFARTQTTTRSKIHTAFADVFAKYDLMIWPTTPTVAFPHPGPEGGPTEIAGVKVREPALDNQRFTEAVSHAGYPAISVPAGFTSAGLPVGMQIAAEHGCEVALLRAAAAFEAIAPWSARRPVF